MAKVRFVRHLDYSLARFIANHEKNPEAAAALREEADNRDTDDDLYTSRMFFSRTVMMGSQPQVGDKVIAWSGLLAKVIDTYWDLVNWIGENPEPEDEPAWVVELTELPLLSTVEPEECVLGLFESGWVPMDPELAELLAILAARPAEPKSPRRSRRSMPTQITDADVQKWIDAQKTKITDADVQEWIDNNKDD